MTFFRTAALTVSVLALAACSSAPVRYYTLAPADLVAPAPAAATPAMLIEVLPVGIPAQLDQQPLVLRRGAGGVAVAEGDRWAGPLSEEFRTALSAGLSRRLGARDVAGLPGASSQPVLRIKVQVRRLDGWLGQRALLDADWTLSRSGDPDRLTCSTRLEQPAAGDMAALVQAQQQLVAGLAEAIARNARRLDGAAAVCQLVSP